MSCSCSSILWDIAGTVYRVNEAEGVYARCVDLVVEVWNVEYPMGTFHGSNYSRIDMHCRIRQQSSKDEQRCVFLYVCFSVCLYIAILVVDV
jgi:hypothetical protein